MLHSFAGAGGWQPWGGLIGDAAGNLYGTASLGGITSLCIHSGCGVIFKLDRAGTCTSLYDFKGDFVDGQIPLAELTRDRTGSFYAATDSGGTFGYGAVIKLDAAGNESLLYSFTGGSDGSSPDARLVVDRAGNLYGTTYNGGAFGYGVVFKVDPAGEETVLHSFTGGSDGANPSSGLVRDSSGNLYGTTNYGGLIFGVYGNGVVFKMDSTGNETVLYSFTGGADGGIPLSGLIRDAAGNLYGTASYGGPSGAGVVFKLAP